MKIAVIGTGRVGLPLALSFIDAGADVIGIEINPEIRNSVNNDLRMPFLEPGFEDILKTGKLKLRSTLDDVNDIDFFVITVGTPLLHHIESDLSAITSVIADLGSVIRPGQTVIMRSTTAPHTTDYVRKLLERNSNQNVGKDIFLACCPERIVEGKAREELLALPQIVGTQDPDSAAAAEKLFSLLGVEILHCDYITAELVKLFNNVSRYAYFAIANALSMIAVDYDAEPYEILRLANHKYPRPITSKPGFSAGTCLRKDFGMLSEAYWSADILVSSWRINETMPKFLVDAALSRWGQFDDFNVVVLGYSFKRDADDVRDTLTDKVLRYLHRSCPRKLTLHDHMVDKNHVYHLHGMEFTHDLESAIEDADLVFIATNHSLYTKKKSLILDRVAKKQTRVVDLWNSLETGSVLLD
jgi:UDP-N-acetyl-D-mannosaminuronic acid dehydrogenase